MNRLQEIACEVSFDADASSSQRDLFQIQPRLFATRLSCVYRDQDNVDQKADISIHHSTKPVSEIEGPDGPSEIDDRLRAGLAYAVELDEISMNEVKEDFRSAKAIGCMLRHFLPERMVYAIDTVVENANAITVALQDDSRRAAGLRRSVERENFLSEEIIAILREVLEGTIDFDYTFNGKYLGASPFGSEPGTLTLGEWYEGLRGLPRSRRLMVQQVLRECDDLFDRVYAAMKASATEKSDTHSVVQRRQPRVITEATWYLENFFGSSLKYLGPLRDTPKPLYPLAPAADPHDVGLRGENTASILELHKSRKIRYIPSANFKDPRIDRKTVTRTLEAAVTDWLQYLGVANSVWSRDRGKLGHELKVGLSNSDSTHDLTHVGVGVSQVLPILLMCLLADTDSTLVFEQPELHLHPRVQTLLGDFFISIVLCSKQCIVETHSEYFIDRIRFRIAAASPESELNSHAKIYFVEKPSRASSFREVVINEYGAIADWPDGFFDQSQQEAEAIITAALAKKRAQRDI